jgi:hypothetical protein
MRFPLTMLKPAHVAEHNKCGDDAALDATW